MTKKNRRSKKAGGGAVSSCCLCCKKKKKQGSPGSKKSGHAASLSLTEHTSTQSEISPSGIVSLEAATEMLPLRSKKERELVMKALEQEMARRRQFKRVVRARPSLVAAGPPSKVQSYFPILPEEKPSEQGGKSGELDEGLIADWAHDEKSVNLDEQRRRWIQNMQKKSHLPPQPSRATSDERPRCEPQPDSLSIDVAAAREIAEHTLLCMLNKLLLQTALKQAIEQRKKGPSYMSPEELVELRRRDEKAWDDFVSTNSVASFGLAKPTPDDEARAKKKLAKYKDTMGENYSGSRSGSRNGPVCSRRPQIHFDDKLDVFNVPVGEDYDPKEKVTAQVVKLHKPDGLR